MWSGTLFKKKLTALAIHLGISALVFIPFLYLIWFHWFPPPFFFTDGGWQGVRIMLLVDMVIGPALTFLIFDPAKTARTLRFDYACIAAVQAAALVYGYVSVEGQRIQAVAFHEGAFFAVTKDPLSKQSIAPERWDRLGPAPPYWVFVRKAASGEEEAGVITWAFTESIEAHQLEFLYEPLAQHWAQVRDASLQRTNPESAESPAPRLARLCAEATEQALAPDKSYCFELKGYFRPAVLTFDETGRLLGWKIGDYDDS